ncbi:MAG TPA: hypothetical protein VEL82_01135 [Thermoplasmata archaeon]|nr:hypothetical protein [Thermoplasmata archaeon]
MSPPRWAVAIAVLLTVSAIGAVVPNLVHGPAPPAAAPRADASPAVGLAYDILNGYGTSTDSFNIGVSGADALYFTIYDPIDSHVNVTITDPNATRDGVPTPAFHYEAAINATTFEFDSVSAGVSYTFPSTLSYGGGWLVNFSAVNAGYVTQTVTLHAYHVTVLTSIGISSTLPGQPVSVYYWLYLDANQYATYTDASNVWITGHYWGNGSYQNFFAGGRAPLPAATGSGEWSGSIPGNATPDRTIDFEVYAITNVSGQIAENESNAIAVEIGALDVPFAGMSSSPSACIDSYANTYTNGTLLAGCLEAGSDYYGLFTPIAGLPVGVAFWNGSAHVTPGTGSVSGLTTNATGIAEFTFLASSPPFVTEIQYPRYNDLNFTVSAPGAFATGSAWTAWSNRTLYVVPGTTASGLVRVLLSQSQYYVGATATASWSISSSSGSATGPITAQEWVVEGPGAAVLDQGTIDSTAVSGTFSFGVVAAMVGTTSVVYVSATNATSGFIGYATFGAIGPALLLAPASTYYAAGTSVSVSATLFGGGTGATIGYKVTGYWPTATAAISSGTVANASSFSVPISASNPPTYVDVQAWATVGNQIVATSSTELYLATGYSIILGVSTPSSYADGSYQPGQTVTLTYQVVGIGGAPLPQVFEFELFAEGFPSVQYLQNARPSGSVSFAIPSNAASGTMLIFLEAGGTGVSDNCLPQGGCEGILALPINAHPSVLQLELGAGSGLTVGWLILLVLIIVVALVLYLVLRRRGGSEPAMMAPDSGMNPPAPPPSTPPAAEWSGPAPTGESPPSGESAPTETSSESPPPLPQPPAGSS